MSRWAAPALFAGLAVFAGAHALHALAGDAAHSTARGDLVALYYLLRAGVAVAFALFTLRRSEPLRRSREPAAFLACAAAMGLVLLVPGPESGTATGLVLAGDLVAGTACVWLLVSVLALGRCFGVLPEARGLVIRGPYRLVRHPVYLGEIGAVLGLTIASPTPWSCAILAAVIAAQTARMRMEESALTAAFPQYRAYAYATGRLLPRVRARRQRASAQAA